jgi:hypothetical protein
MKGIASHNIVRLGIGALCNMEHRGATGAEADTGDGAGILIQVPDAFCRAVAGVELPAAGAYGVGLAFMPQAASDVALAVARIEAIFAESQLRVLAWRDVPVNPSCLGATALAVMPTMRQIFVSDAQGTSGIELDRKLFIARKRVEHELPAELSTYFPSLSARPQQSHAHFCCLCFPRRRQTAWVMHSSTTLTPITSGGCLSSGPPSCPQSLLVPTCLSHVWHDVCNSSHHFFLTKMTRKFFKSGALLQIKHTHLHHLFSAYFAQRLLPSHYWWHSLWDILLHLNIFGLSLSRDRSLEVSHHGLSSG